METVIFGQCEEVVKTTPQITRFRDAKVYNNMATGKLTITEYSLTTSTKGNYKIQKERTLYLVLRLRGETEHDTHDKRDHQDPEHLRHSAHEH